MTDLVKVIKVGIADMNIVRPPDTIRTSGLGSCVGVVVFDQMMEIAGLAHIMLPDSTLSKGSQMNMAKYADTALHELVTRLMKEGARNFVMKAKIAGGAQMFQFSNGNDLMRIGPRNVEAVRATLADLRIRIVSEDVGGNSGRTIEFNPKTCMLNIRMVNKGMIVI
ncbi:chemotaxis protein CheD [Peribacillus cavernae]|uniref:Probable chemoreceptor glutamine deamidase CheD n=1 Tax=Peribacillus cavernae TaxID=1674310 RepID=A0A3S0TYN8_9BACI|nr:chemotaxis protein CheD [Peribacillus cavernae]MDQ0217053.1 chemotaxis protein CheD [Peribacillus cavernae]RUQ30468.1 chemotaxis protein CheD [Peribacillus cavernae]